MNAGPSGFRKSTILDFCHSPCYAYEFVFLRVFLYWSFVTSCCSLIKLPPRKETLLQRLKVFLYWNSSSLPFPHSICVTYSDSGSNWHLWRALCSVVRCLCNRKMPPQRKPMGASDHDEHEISLAISGSDNHVGRVYSMCWSWAFVMFLYTQIEQHSMIFSIFVELGLTPCLIVSHTFVHFSWIYLENIWGLSYRLLE